MPRSSGHADQLRRRVARFTKKLHAVDSLDPAAVHQTRVATRRLREVVPLLQLRSAAAEKLGRRLRKATRRLGEVREVDVLHHLVQELGQRGDYNAGGLGRLDATLADERAARRARLVDKGHVRDIHRIAEKLDRVAAEEPKGDDKHRNHAKRSLQWVVDARIARRASTLASEIGRAGGIYFTGHLHPVRIAVKKLRYAMELSTDVAGLRSTPDLRQLRRAQDILGNLHDLEILLGRARDLQASLAPLDVKAWREVDTLVRVLEDDCRRLHGRYLSERDGLVVLCARHAGRAPDVKPQKAGASRLS
jgi:CHAD domain-containing protein